ncbi:MAG: tRNA (N6-isopentenyl adenosine(37)-C2)-methylthiotransferase MiaB [Armatimonadetes bacterium]|nr:tRNA (N6-isopentenyl adenosine(37)-C2)-methylthiotransferase MiaB [Armatimonadota bacterium]
MGILLAKERAHTLPELAGRTYHIVTFGCQMNLSDSERIEALLSDAGMRREADLRRADLVLFNTCSVRQKAEDRVYGNLGRLKQHRRAHPEMILGVCGCMAQREGEALRRKVSFVDLVIGTAQLHRLPEMAAEIWRTGQAQVATEMPRKRNQHLLEAEEDLLAGIARGNDPYKAWVPAMYGCDKFCAFCIVPMTRGAERSRRPEEIEAQVRASGRKEVTLLGQTVNSYGRKLPEPVTFADLLRRLNAIEGLERIRFTSPHPADFSDDLIDAIAALPKVCEHVHLPLQSGDDSALALMRRGYTVAEYERVYWRLRERVPGISITTDLLAGHPGEMEEQHRNSLRTVERLRFDAAFTFAFSPRPHTRAEHMPDPVPHDVKMRRLQEMIDLQNAITMERNAAHIGEVHQVLVEGPSDKDPEMLSGYARNNKLAHFPGPARLAGRLVPVRVTEAHIWGLGAVVDMC